MKEHGGFFEKALKIWTYITIPLELYLLGHGIITHNSTEALLGIVGLGVDILTLKWLGRNKRNEYKNIPYSQLSAERRGSERFKLKLAA